MGEKFGTTSSKLYGVSAKKKGTTPNVGRAWKSSLPSLWNLLALKDRWMPNTYKT